MDLYTLALSVAYTNKAINEAEVEGFKVQVETTRDILETIGEEKTFYFLPKVVSEPQNGYDEYIYVNNSWELVGSTDIDVSSKENSENKVDAITDSNKSSDTLYPSIKAVVDYQNVVMIPCEYSGEGITTVVSSKTISQILGLLNNGKSVRLYIAYSNNYISPTIWEVVRVYVEGGKYEARAIHITPVKDGKGGYAMHISHLWMENANGTNTTWTAHNDYVAIGAFEQIDKNT